MVGRWLGWQAAGGGGWQEVVKGVARSRAGTTLGHFAERDPSPEGDDVAVRAAPKRPVVEPLARVWLLTSLHVSQDNASDEDSRRRDPKHRHYAAVNRPLQTRGIGAAPSPGSELRVVSLPAAAEPAVANKMPVTDEAVVVGVAQQQRRVARHAGGVSPEGLLVVAVLAAAGGTPARRRIAAGLALAVRPARVPELTTGLADAPVLVETPAANADVPASTLGAVAVDARLVRQAALAHRHPDEDACEAAVD